MPLKRLILHTNVGVHDLLYSPCTFLNLLFYIYQNAVFNPQKALPLQID